MVPVAMRRKALGARDPIATTDRLIAFEHEHGQALFGFARRLGLPDGEAMDVVQDLFVRLYSQLDSGKPMTNDRGWAYQTTYRLAMDQHRARRRQLAIVTRLEPQGATRDDRPDDRIVVWAAVDELPERQRAVVYLRYRADMPFGEIARVLGITASAARSHAAQAMAALRRQLGAEEGAT